MYLTVIYPRPADGDPNPGRRGCLTIHLFITGMQQGRYNYFSNENICKFLNFKTKFNIYEYYNNNNFNYNYILL